MTGIVAERGAPHLTVRATADLTLAERDHIVALCTRAFEQDFADLFDFVTNSMHVLAYRENRLIGHACWTTRWLQPDGHPALRTAYVDAVAIDPADQGQGIGSAVMRRVADEARDFALNALSSTQAVGFYERLGWERWRGPTAVRTPQGVVPTPEDTVLILRTATTPALDTAGLLIADPRGGQPW